MTIEYRPTFTLNYELDQYEDGKHIKEIRCGTVKDVPGIIAILKEYGCLPEEDKNDSDEEVEDDDDYESLQRIKKFLVEDLGLIMESKDKEYNDDLDNVLASPPHSPKIHACLRETLESKPFSICITIDGQKKYYVPSWVKSYRGKITQEMLLEDLLECIKKPHTNSK